VSVTWTHLKLRRDGDGIAWLAFDRAGSATNTLSAEVLAEFTAALDALDHDPPKGLVITSAKPAGFIAGADIAEFTRIAAAADARALVERGWRLFGRLARVGFPTVALIRGHCLGGGLELALACRYRVVVDEPATRLALPEVMLGIMPAWGGMQRLPALIGPAAALDLMLTGKPVDAKKAARLGLADACVPPRVMDDAARIIVTSGRRPRRPPLVQRLMNGPGRRLVADRARKQLAARVRREHYPAPYAILDIWAHYGGNALAVPADAPASLEAIFRSPTAKNLVRVFFLQERLKGFGKAEGPTDGQAAAHTSGNAIAPAAARARARDGSQSAASDTAQETNQETTRETIQESGQTAPRQARPQAARGTAFAPRHVHVVGAGVMGGDIAALCALRGLTVSLQDQSAERIAPAIARATKLFERKSKGDARAVRFALDRLLPDPAGHGVARADVVIEAIFEDLDAKRALFADLERRARPDAVLATNTSSLRIEDIAAALARPERLVGIHFFNPVAQMPLVEVVAGAASDADALHRAALFVRHLDKLPLPVKSAPGFLVNAVLGPYLHEALVCVDEGIAAETVDAALEAFGMPMGPIELVDTVGLDIALAAGKALAGEAAATPRRLAELAAAGHLGRKSGQGFYRWEAGKPRKAAAGPLPEGLAERIVAPLVAATRRCVEQRIVADAELADAGVIFGTGFAPFTGGPLHHAAQRGEPHANSRRAGGEAAIVPAR
jgi:3-hydroxyacyl-CoA dehydrogenase/enoyl-CoA hydratase/3-hydroxybutyryl-CoA epimerase